MKMIFIYAILLLSLFGCSTSNEKVADSEDKLQVSNESKQVDDFKVSINVDENSNATATITYIGDASEKEIYHGGSIFLFNIYQQDGDFKYEGAMNTPLLSTTLIQNEPYTVNFNLMEELNVDLEKGLYEFEAIADFSLDSNNLSGTSIEIPVSKLKEI